MSPAQVIKWILYILAILVLVIPMTLPMDKVTLCVILLLNSMFWQHEPQGKQILG